MNSSTLGRRKRALYTGLQPFLETSELLAALILWESNYSSAPTFSLRYFIEDLQKKINQEVDTRRVHIRLIDTLNKPDKDLLPYPSKAIANYKTRIRSEVDYNYQIPEIEALQLFVAKWFSLTPKHLRDDILDYCFSNLSHLKADKEFKSSFEIWLKDTSRKMKIALAEASDLRQITNLLYLAYCDVMGPVKADELLSQAVHEVRNNGGAAYGELYAKLL